MNSDNPCRAVVVDDDDLVRGVITGMLSQLGAEVVGEAENGEQAVQVFKECNPDITFLDIQLPIKSGTDALKEILEINAQAVVVMLTASADMDIADECMEFGAQEYIRKGANPDVLVMMLEGALNTYKSS
mgnify:FL=1